MCREKGPPIPARKGSGQYLLGWVDALDAFDPRRNSWVQVGPHWWVLGLLRAPLGQRHLAGRLLSHFWRLRKPLGLALWVKKSITFSSLLKPIRQYMVHCPSNRSPGTGAHSQGSQQDPFGQT